MLVAVKRSSTRSGRPVISRRTFLKGAVAAGAAAALRPGRAHASEAAERQVVKQASERIAKLSGRNRSSFAELARQLDEAGPNQVFLAHLVNAASASHLSQEGLLLSNYVALIDRARQESKGGILPWFNHQTSQAFLAHGLFPSLTGEPMHLRQMELASNWMLERVRPGQDLNRAIEHVRSNNEYFLRSVDSQVLERLQQRGVVDIQTGLLLAAIGARAHGRVGSVAAHKSWETRDRNTPQVGPQSLGTQGIVQAVQDKIILPRFQVAKVEAAYAQAIGLPVGLYYARDEPVMAVAHANAPGVSHAFSAALKAFAHSLGLATVSPASMAPFNANQLVVAAIEPRSGEPVGARFFGNGSELSTSTMLRRVLPEHSGRVPEGFERHPVLELPISWLPQAYTPRST